MNNPSATLPRPQWATLQEDGSEMSPFLLLDAPRYRPASDFTLPCDDANSANPVRSN